MSRNRSGGSAEFETYREFNPDNIPEPGSFLTGHDVLVEREHYALHRLARMLFEERGVYDMTFGYNLARLNLDPRHPDAGFRYAREAEDSKTLRAEFTPTTEFCPQSDTLSIGAFRAFNGEGDRHEYDLVRVRVADMHQGSEPINEKLSEIEESFVESGELPGETPIPGSGGSPTKDTDE